MKRRVAFWAGLTILFSPAVCFLGFLAYHMPGGFLAIAALLLVYAAGFFLFDYGLGRP